MEITASLLALKETRTAYERATRHPFLRAAGQLTLSASGLASWLTQDRLYALCGYSAFLGTLIAKVPAPEAGPNDAASKQHRRRLTVLAGAMANIDREVGFFEDVARQNNLDLATRPEKRGDEESEALANPITRGYIDYMVATASRGSFEEGLVLLWAMEKLYLDAWTYASSFLSRNDSNSTHLSNRGPAQALPALIKNWSSSEFAKFVEDIAALVDELDVGLDTKMGMRLVEVWKTTLWYEERFWRAGSDLA